MAIARRAALRIRVHTIPLSYNRGRGMPAAGQESWPGHVVDGATAREPPGMACLLLGISGILLAVLDGLEVLPWAVTRIWLHSPALLLLASCIAIVVGCRWIWRSDHRKTGWTPRRSGPRFNSVVLYTRANCELCEEAKLVLAGYRDYLPPLVEVDIDATPRLVQSFGECVPVVEIDGKVRFRGRVSEPLLRRLIDAETPVDMTASHRPVSRPASSKELTRPTDRD
jgi:glutaredoxin